MKLKKVVLENEKGGEMTLTFDETFSSEDVAKVLKMLQDPTPSNPQEIKVEPPSITDFKGDIESMTIREKLNLVVQQIKYGWFTSDHIRELYHYNYNEEIKPSTVSTYLARMFNEAILERRGSRARREYRLAESEITVKAPIKYV